MKLDKFIEKLNKIKEEIGGDTEENLITI